MGRNQRAVTAAINMPGQTHNKAATFTTALNSSPRQGPSNYSQQLLTSGWFWLEEGVEEGSAVWGGGQYIDIHMLKS